jgi:hypothetical protein
MRGAPSSSTRSLVAEKADQIDQVLIWPTRK